MYFAHLLALETGEWDVDGMLSRMSNRQFLRWMAFYKLAPWGDERADYRAGTVAATIANCTPRKRGSNKKFKPQDFMAFKRKSPEQKQGLIKSYFSMLAASAELASKKKNKKPKINGNDSNP